MDKDIKTSNDLKPCLDERRLGTRFLPKDQPSFTEPEEIDMRFPVLYEFPYFLTDISNPFPCFYGDDIGGFDNIEKKTTIYKNENHNVFDPEPTMEVNPQPYKGETIQKTPFQILDFHYRKKFDENYITPQDHSQPVVCKEDNQFFPSLTSFNYLYASDESWETSTLYSLDIPATCHFESCSKQFYRRSAFKSHLDTHLDARYFTCITEGCGKRFKRKSDLSRHSRAHSIENDFMCTDCEKRFYRSDTLKRHLKRCRKSTKSI
ncbi:hypothetical protein J3Q64DRAFT_1844708 [Phycomyces blakesleeanus]|uniref:C2H2-type domain-containing protein n=1 Tax=Phycomyces blakesleeanus TaxID=4837 RepID=A0ABR3BEV9_PHYBL